MLQFSGSDRPRFYDLKLLDAAKEGDTAGLYDAQLRYFDQEIGRLVEDLKKQGIYDQTAFILTGDHGCGINFEKHQEYSLYEERVRVPLIVKYPNWAVQKRVPPKVVNSMTEIQKILYALFGRELPEILRSLPQYQEGFENFAFSETIMNPNRQYKRHNMAMMNPPYKYVCWNEIDWDQGRVEKYGKESLYQWDAGSDAFDETKDLISTNVTVAEQQRKLARQVIESNLNFLAKHPPRKY